MIFVVLQAPCLVITFQLLRTPSYVAVSVVSQVLDNLLVVVGLTHAALLSWAAATKWTSGHRPAFWTAAFGALMAIAVGSAVLGAPEAIQDNRALAAVALAGALVSPSVVRLHWPVGARLPLPADADTRKVVAAMVTGVVSVGGLQAYNTLEFAPARQALSLTTTTEATATVTADGRTRIVGTITTENVSDLPAMIIASQYVVMAVDVTDTSDWPLSEGDPDPMSPDELIDNGIGERTVISQGSPWRPYQRVNGKAKAEFDFAVETARAETAFRVVVRLFSARADRLSLEGAAKPAPESYLRDDEVGSQLVRVTREGSRLRAFAREPIVVISTWWHGVSNDRSTFRPDLNVYFAAKSDRDDSYPDVGENALADYGLARQFYESTVFLSEPEDESEPPVRPAGLQLGPVPPRPNLELLATA